MQTNPTHPTPRRTALALAVVADVDPRTAARYLRGEPVRGLVAVRLARAAAGLGLAPTPTKEATPESGNSQGPVATTSGTTHGKQQEDRTAA